MLTGEGAYPIILIEPPSATRNDYGELAQNAPAEYPRKAMRLADQTAGNEQILGEAAIAVGGALTWIVRRDDELEGYDIDLTDPANPTLVKNRERINAKWQLRDVATGLTYDIVSVTEYRIRNGELRYKLHTKTQSVKSNK